MLSNTNSTFAPLKALVSKKGILNPSATALPDKVTLRKLDFSLLGHIALVADQDHLRVFRREILDLIHPLFYAFK